MSDDALKPAVDKAVAVPSKKQRYTPSIDVSVSSSSASSLVSRCQAVVVANLERYPPEALSMLSEDEWDDIVIQRHKKTAPLKGKGGLDGTGRKTPALSDKFLTEVETACPHLSASRQTDELIWKDCVEYRFTRGGLTRPRGLLLPWPLLVKQISDQSNVLVSFKKREDAADNDNKQLETTEAEEKTILNATQALKESPMNLALLKQSGIGKTLKKIIKASSNRGHKSIFKRLKIPVAGSSNSTAVRAGLGSPAREISVLKHLEQQLQAWMDLAASQGVDVQTSSSNKKSERSLEQFEKDANDLKKCETCKSWRQLFATLKERADQRRFNLGQKMRENRKKENSMRPQIVKVRPANPRREAILHKQAASQSTWGRGGGTVDSHGGSKILQLRKEAAAQSAREKAGISSHIKKQSGFGAAVAFASTTKLSAKQKMIQQQNRKRQYNQTVGLGGGKRMGVPQGAIRMQGTKLPSQKPPGSSGSSLKKAKYRR